MPDTPFVSLMAVEADRTLGEADTRIFPPGVFTWNPTILAARGFTIYAQTENAGHDGADAVGHLSDVKRVTLPSAQLDAIVGFPVEGDFAVVGRGVFDGDTEKGAEVAQLVENGTLAGVSLDPRDAVIDSMCVETAEDEFGEYCARFEDRFLMYNLVGFTVLSTPGIEQATIMVADDQMLGAYEALVSVGPGAGAGNDDAPDEGDEMAAALLASAILGDRTAPPRAYFEVPEPDQLTPWTVLDAGEDGWVRVMGHVAPAEGSGVCHIGYPGECKEAPPSATEYAYFNLRAFPTSDGDVAVGCVTMGCGHAPLKLGRKPVTAAEAAGHYDHEGYAAAYVHAVNGQHGWWVSGVARPTLTADQLLDLKLAVLSGDWRGINGHAEGIAALAVNVPGFPIPRQHSLAASGRLVGMVAAGIVAPCDCDERRNLAASATLPGRVANLEREMARQRALNEDREIEALSASVRGHDDGTATLAELALRRG